MRLPLFLVRSVAMAAASWRRQEVDRLWPALVEQAIDQLGLAVLNQQALFSVLRDLWAVCELTEVLSEQLKCPRRSPQAGMCRRR
jgi:hypothetical protein